MQFDLIAAIDKADGISKNGIIPWAKTDAGREDMFWFKILTKDCFVVMGRKTWESIPIKYRPLTGRVNVVISSLSKGTTIVGALTNSPVVYVESFNAALLWCAQAVKDKSYTHRQCMVIGGASVYKQALVSPWIHHAEITRLSDDYSCDLKFPVELLVGAKCDRDRTFVTNRILNQYFEYDFTNADENNYRVLIKKLLLAPIRPNRTGINTRGLFHEVLKFNLSDGRGMILPLITSKKTNLHAIYHELIWFLRGSTETSYLKENNVSIWDGNTTREFLDARGLNNYPVGTLGPGYGHQWRNLTTQTGTKIDQIMSAINLLKTDPWSRRIVVNAWNVEQLDQMALVPCHYSFQFLVDGDESGKPTYLNCLVNMRSTDCFLGLPFNLTSYSMLTHIIAHITGLTAKTLSISMADCHLYETHIEATRKMLQRRPYRFPTLEFSEKIKSTENITIDDFAHKFTLDDYIVSNYICHPYIKADMAI